MKSLASFHKREILCIRHTMPVVPPSAGKASQPLKRRQWPHWHRQSSPWIKGDSTQGTTGQWGPAVWHREFSTQCWVIMNLKENGCVYVQNWITLMYSRSDHALVNQFSFNKTSNNGEKTAGHKSSKRSDKADRKGETILWSSTVCRAVGRNDSF